MSEGATSNLIFGELRRIADGRNAKELQDFFLVLPLVGEDEVLKFLRSVPAGATAEEVQRMAMAFRAATDPFPVDESR